MAVFYSFPLLILYAVASARAAPPAAPRPASRQPAQAHLQDIHPFAYFSDNSEVANYYSQVPHKSGGPGGVPARLESLEPDSEVELIPGAQQPQQPPQQTPVAPNLPGLAPGQRVFIVHMPVPGYRPGTIGGYQPVYIVAAAPQGNSGYATNGYQNTLLLSPNGQVIQPVFGYHQGALGAQPSGLLVGGGLPYNRPFEQAYQEPVFAYQPVGAPQGGQSPLQFSQLVNLQAQQAAQPGPARPATHEALSAPKRVGEASESNETSNGRPGPQYAPKKSS